MATAAPKFVPGPVLSHGSPRSPPPSMRGYGDSCFRAMCYLETDDDAQRRLASFIGYGSTLDIVGEVEGTCTRHSKNHVGSHCSAANLTFVASSSLECAGQVYFFYEPS